MKNKSLLSTSKCRNKVVIEISVEELMAIRVILGAIKSQQKTLKNLISGIKKVLNGKTINEAERQAISDAVDYPENFHDDFENFFDNYEAIASLFSYSEKD